MGETSRMTRRAAIATMGGGMVAVAIAAPSLKSDPTLTSFGQAFSSPSVSLDRAGDTTWSAEIGSVLQVQNGPRLRIRGVETGASYGQHAELIRSRSFLVNFDVVDTTGIAGDAVYRVTHDRYGSFDLFLKTAAATPRFVQAAFN